MRLTRLFRDYVSHPIQRYSLVRNPMRVIAPLLILVGSGVYAQATGGDTGGAVGASDLTSGIIEVMNLLFSMIALLLGPMVILAGWLLTPDWTMGDFFGLRGYFREVWILVSNITYIIFALMLLYMAIMQIFGGSESEFAFKQKLPSFLVGILMVPFTWMIVSFTLSFANQAVAAVLSIPMGAITKQLDTGFDPENPSGWYKKVIPTKLYFSGKQDGIGFTPCKGGKKDDGENGKTDCISPASFLSNNSSGPFFIIMVYAYDIFKIHETDIVDLENLCVNTVKGESENAYKDAKSCTSELVDILRDFGLNLIITVFFAILLIALCWVLLMRAIKLWIYIMLSPLFGLAYFTGKGFSEAFNSEGGGESSGLTDELGFKNFFKLAMVPVLVSAVLAFGLLFVGVVRDNFQGGTKEDPITVEGVKLYCNQGVGFMVKYCITETPGANGQAVYASRLIIGNDNTKTGDTDKTGAGKYTISLEFGSTLSQFVGGVSSTGEGNLALAGGTGAVGGVIGSVNDLFAHIILTIMSLVFIWMGIKAAVSYDTVTTAAFAPFAKLGSSVATFVQHSPSYLPLPHPAFQALTPQGMEFMANKINQKVTNDRLEVGKSLQDVIGGRFNALQEASEELRNGAADFSKFAKSVNNLESLAGKPSKIVSERTIEQIDKISDEGIKNDPKVQAFLTDLKTDPEGKKLGQIFERHDEAIQILEQKTETKGIAQIATKYGAIQEAVSHPFHGAQFDNGGNITIAGTSIVTKNTNPPGGYTVSNLSDERKKHIGNVVSATENIEALTNAQISDRLGGILGSGVTLPNDESDRKNLLIELKRQRMDH